MAETVTVGIPDISKEYVHTGITADNDPTAMDVFFGFSESFADEPDSWAPGEWLTGQQMVRVNGQYKMGWVARVLISGAGRGGALEVPEGTWYFWIKLEDVDQSLVRSAGRVKVT